MLLGRMLGVRHLDVVIEVELAPLDCRYDLKGVTIERQEIIDIIARHHTPPTAVRMEEHKVDIRLIEYVRE